MEKALKKCAGESDQKAAEQGTNKMERVYRRRKWSRTRNDCDRRGRDRPDPLSGN